MDLIQEWTLGRSGVPQGLVFWPSAGLYLIPMINDVDGGLHNLISKFTDNTANGNSFLSSMPTTTTDKASSSDRWEMAF